MIENKQILVKNKRCDHLPIIEEINQEIDKNQNEIGKISNRIDQAVVYKQNEIKNVQAKIKQAQNEIKSLSKKSKFNEEKSLEIWTQKIEETE